MNPITIMYSSIESPTEKRRTCSFDYLGLKFRGWTLVDQSVPLSEQRSSFTHGTITLNGIQIPWVEHISDETIFRTLINQAKPRILIRGAKKTVLRSLSENTKMIRIVYGQDLRWGPNHIEVIETTYTQTLEKASVYKLPKGGGWKFTIDPTMYTPSGTWVDSQAEYFGRELLL